MSVSIAPTETETITSLSLVPELNEELSEHSELELLKASCIVRQTPISVTLGGPSICILTLGIVLAIHFLDSYLAEAVVSIVPVALLIHNDYNNFLSLGPGGTPATIQGYIRITCLRMLSLRDPFTAPKPDPNRLPKAGVLSAQVLPYRAGPRPVVAGIAPQRQLDQHGDRRCYFALRRAMERLSAQNPTKFGTERSCLEKHGLALFARHPLQTNCQGEICHVHDSDHSMHMSLHPDDIKEILQKGWGQRHPLAWKGKYIQMPVAQEFVMVYAPRDEMELDIVCKIISAAIWYTLAEDVKMSLK
ncbi:hypothetical protein TGAM01_v207242 [Trichoderma gamsii]|uniref:Luciferase domain-containing protein n=1 Tax=Trichoderma gamsii TaxID=398673 RepID=A0A0W7VUI9_9HYPO|nr:hypothetical protein TGAM01_v207242 [Trichoderma gamsii]PNP46617.1 hypothetical protein TGAMA5MH_01562 [Trichoderma gamsii]PON23914.1 hypothetical protein TGAM01_v207242 [Trichoderma gamsii]